MMKYFYLLIIANWVILVNTIAQNDSDSTLISHEGTIRSNVISRGCYQYYINHSKEDYFPDSLPDSFKQNGLKIFFSAILKTDSTLLLKPSPTDQPVPMRKIRNIQIIEVKKDEKNNL